MSITPEEAIKLFPAPTFRRYQKEVVKRIAEAFSSGIRCILVEAPTGFGKSYVNATFCRYYKSFYATPQLTLIDQILNDKYLKNIFVEIKGRENYTCAFDFLSTVKTGMCRKIPNFKCDRFRVCPYWKQKLKASVSNSAIMSFAYLLLEGLADSPVPLGSRELLVLDESHSIAEHIVEHVSIEISPFSIPKAVYNSVRRFIHEDMDTSDIRGIVQMTKSALEELLKFRQMRFAEGMKLTEAEIEENDRMTEFIKNADMLLNSETEWVSDVTWVTYKNEKIKILKVRPLLAKEFAQKMLWWRADKFIISSATILDATLFVKEVGLWDLLQRDEILMIKVPSTFPPENRPIVDATIGKMTKDKREENLPKAVKMIEKIIEIEKGKNIAIHCHSYEIAKYIASRLSEKYGDKIIFHNSADRTAKLELWKRSRGKVFVCVAFEEGHDWKGDICGAQIIVKIPYPDLKDKRVHRRLELGHWNWFRFCALRDLIQAYGRAVRSPTEKKKTYIVDASIEPLLTNMWKFVPKWFRDALPTWWNRDKMRLLKKYYKRKKPDAWLIEEANRILRDMNDDMKTKKIRL